MRLQREVAGIVSAVQRVFRSLRSLSYLIVFGAANIAARHLEEVGAV